MPLKPSLVFFGTGPVSLATLKGIAEAFDFEAVITRPDRLIHNQPVPHPVKAWAIEKGIAVLTADTKSELDLIIANHQFNSQLGLVVDFGIILSQHAINSFPKGILNSHFSLLPQWRGPDPITPAILSGAQETGVSIMEVTAGLDEGPVVAQEIYRLTGTETINQLTEALVKLSNSLLIKIVPDYLAGKLSAQSQTGTPSHTHKLSKSDGQIDWAKPAVQIEREIRAYLGWPSSYGKLLDTDVIITAAQVVSVQGQPGQAFRTEDKLLAVYCGQGSLVIQRLKPVGKREMSGVEFLAGRQI